MQFGEWSPGGQEMVTSGGEGKKCRARTHDRTPPLRNGFQTFPSAHPGGRESGGRAMGWGGGPGPCAGGGPGPCAGGGPGD